jgi:hypothetical protein
MWEVPPKYGVSFLKSECQVSAFFQKGLKKEAVSIKIAMKEEELLVFYGTHLEEG